MLRLEAPELLDPTRIANECRWMARVPDEPMANADFRWKIVRDAQRTPDIRTDCWTACRESLLFFTNVFLWTYDPRKRVKKVPFVTWPFQNEAMLRIEKHIGESDLLIEKSRDMGASWMILAAFMWRWMFFKGESFLLVSRNQSYVDDKNNPKSLFWKLDFMLSMLPPWLCPAYRRTDMELVNVENGSVVNGESTTGDVARGDRRTAIMLDEFAAVDHADGHRALSATFAATDSRIINSTAQGSIGAYADLVRNAHISRIRLGWWLHPHKNVGLEKDGNGKWTSPWYVRQCARMGDARKIAQELDMALRASESSSFTEDAIAAANRETRPHEWRGNLVFDRQTGEPTALMEDRVNGRIRLWVHPTPVGRIDTTDRRYFIGVDISSGTGSINSVASIGVAPTGEMIGELADPTMRPDQFAEYCVALARLLKGTEDCLLAWEGPGPGHHFGARTMELGYRSIWYRQADDGTGRITLKAGWWPTKDNKRTLYSEFRAALANGQLQVPCKETVAECRDIVYAKNGWVLNVHSINLDDPSGATVSHADRPTSAAIMWMAMRDQVVGADPKGRPSRPPVGSKKWRMEMLERQAARRKSADVDMCATATRE